MTRKNYCIDCGNKCSYRAKRCRKCSDKYPKHNIPHKQETKNKISESLTGNIPWNKGKKASKSAWNKGLTKEIDERVFLYSKKSGESRKGKTSNIIVSNEERERRRLRMIGDKNPTKLESTRKKISQSLINTYKKHPEILENRKSSGKNQYSNYFTSIEKSIAKCLIENGIAFRHNYKIGRYFVDFLIFENVIIECDGEYWHNQKTEAKERERDKFLLGLGYYLFHLKECTITENSIKCVISILKILTHLCHREILTFNGLYF